jgi:hypothetical protein
MLTRKGVIVSNTVVGNNFENDTSVIISKNINVWEQFRKKYKMVIVSKGNHFELSKGITGHGNNFESVL